MVGEGFQVRKRRSVRGESSQSPSDCPLNRSGLGRTEKFVDDMKELLDFFERRVKINVEGLDTCNVSVDLVTALEDIFQTCGKVHNIEIKVNPVSKLIRSCIVFLLGEGAKEKALLLDGCEINGKKLSLTSVERPHGSSTFFRAAKYVSDFQRKRSEAISVTGYGPLSEDALKNALCNLFSPCGVITDIDVLDSHALVHLYGLGSVQQAIQLNGTKIGGFSLTVQLTPYKESEVESARACDEGGVIFTGSRGAIFI